LRFNPTSVFVASSSSASCSTVFDAFAFRTDFLTSSGFCSCDSETVFSVDLSAFAGLPLFFG
jgi:hypothetical protein